ncbi:hypothetical protein [Parasitella parasitica]|uniref:Uncharacterized protein n=1 Tax=Parasitella parasitica TaxID=35722 RepID=A0A0B7N9W3_9FUNG|nr:hypothetical protein [Parasitella parasitica]
MTRNLPNISTRMTDFKLKGRCSAHHTNVLIHFIGNGNRIRLPEADDGLVIAETKQPVLLIECKRCSHIESKQDFNKLIHMMDTVNKTYKRPVVGILIIGELILVYLLIKKSNYRFIVEISLHEFLNKEQTSISIVHPEETVRGLDDGA